MQSARSILVMLPPVTVCHQNGGGYAVIIGIRFTMLHFAINDKGGKNKRVTTLHGEE